MRQWLMLFCLTLTLQPEHVKRVIDGDTFVLFHVGIKGEEHVRLSGVDTPEKKSPGADEATAFTVAWLKQGPSEFTTCKRDDFGRLLASVVRGRESLSGALIESGLVHAITR